MTIQESHPIIDLKTVRWRHPEDDQMEVDEEIAFVEMDENINMIKTDIEHKVFATVIPRSQHGLPDCV